MGLRQLPGDINVDSPTVVCFGETTTPPLVPRSSSCHAAPLQTYLLRQQRPPALIEVNDRSCGVCEHPAFPWKRATASASAVKPAAKRWICHLKWVGATRWPSAHGERHHRKRLVAQSE